MSGVLLLLCLWSAVTVANAQLEFTKKHRLVFLGTDQIEGKKIIAGIYVMPLDSFRVEIRGDVLDDWKRKDSFAVKLSIDKRTISEDLYYIESAAGPVPAYRYTGKGYELLLARERIYEYVDTKGEQQQGISMSYAQLTLPKKRKSYVRTLPVMFEK